MNTKMNKEAVNNDKVTLIDFHDIDWGYDDENDTTTDILIVYEAIRNRINEF